MKNPIAILAGAVICTVAIPIIVSIISYDEEDLGSINKNNVAIEKSKEIKNYETVNKESPKISMYNHKTGSVENLDIEEYLCGVLAGEMPVEFHIEALKAQAIAARTLVLHKEEKAKPAEHNGAVVCSDFNHCQEYKSQQELKEIKGDEWMKDSYPKIQQAVKETKGQVIVHNDELILPLYFSTSSGQTENSEEVFSEAYPYLRSVESPYDKNSPKYASTLKISNKDFVSAMKKSYPNIELSETNLSEQIKITQRSEGGSVEELTIGNVELSGRDVRSIFALNSSNFEIVINDEHIDIVVKGFGHGVGMSQWGADGMANEGYMYYDILMHYYSETDIKDIY